MSSYSDRSIEELFFSVRQRDPLAFEELYSRTWKDLFSIAYKRLRDEDTCKDILQEIYIDLWNRAPDLEVVNIKSYLSTATRYKIISHISRSSGKSHVFEHLEYMLESYDKADHSLNKKELQRIVDLWIDTLPKKRKEIFLLKIESNKTTNEISSELNISRKTVQNQLHTALSGLKIHLNKLALLLSVLFF